MQMHYFAFFLHFFLKSVFPLVSGICLLFFSSPAANYIFYRVTAKMEIFLRRHKEYFAAVKKNMGANVCRCHVWAQHINARKGENIAVQNSSHPAKTKCAPLSYSAPEKIRMFAVSECMPFICVCAAAVPVVRACLQTAVVVAIGCWRCRTQRTGWATAFTQPQKKKSNGEMPGDRGGQGGVNLSEIDFLGYRVKGEPAPYIRVVRGDALSCPNQTRRHRIRWRCNPGTTKPSSVSL